MTDPAETIESSDSKGLLGDGDFLFKDKENNRTVVDDKPVDPPVPVVTDTPPVVPPVEPPPVDTPPVDTPPVVPPVDTPPVDTPPVLDDIKSIVPESILNPTDAPPELDEALPDDMDDKAKNAFIKQRHAMKEKDNIIKELNVKLTEQGDPEVVVQLKEALTKANDKIGMLDLSQHPAFQNKYEVPKQAILARVKSAMTDAGVDETIADKAASMNLINRSNYLAEHVPDIKDALLPYFSQIDTLDVEKDAALVNHKSTTDQMRTQLATNQSQQRTEFKEKVVSTAFANLQDSNHFAFRKGDGEGMEDWNKKVEATIATGKQLMDSDDTLSQTQFMLAGVAVPTYLEVIKNLTDQNKQYVAEIKKHRGANPSIGASDSEPKSTDDRDKSKGMSSGDVGKLMEKRMKHKASLS